MSRDAADLLRDAADAMAAADAYHPWDAWSLNHACILWQMDLIARGQVRSMLELGAGYSTVALAEFAARVAPETRIDTVEHYPPFAVRVAPHLGRYEPVKLHVPQLRQLKTISLDDCVGAERPYEAFMAHSERVPDEQLLEHLDDLFYELDPSAWEPESLDLLVVDGPNSSGRAIAFAFFAPAVRVPGHVLIDDYLHRPFLYYLGRFFEFEITHRLEGAKQYGTVMVRLTRRK